MKPISEWTDDEVEAAFCVGLPTHDEDVCVAGEVLRLRSECQSLCDLWTGSGTESLIRLARAESAEAELARMRPVVEAALELHFDLLDVLSPEDPFVVAVDAYRNGENQ